MKNEAKAEEITQMIYDLYGSNSGHLFGITPDLRHAVKAIVDTTIAIRDKEVKDAINKFIRDCFRKDRGCIWTKFNSDSLAYNEAYEILKVELEGLEE